MFGLYQAKKIWNKDKIIKALILFTQKQTLYLTEMEYEIVMKILYIFHMYAFN